MTLENKSKKCLYQTHGMSQFLTQLGLAPELANTPSAPELVPESASLITKSIDNLPVSEPVPGLVDTLHVPYSITEVRNSLCVLIPVSTDIKLVPEPDPVFVSRLADVLPVPIPIQLTLHQFLSRPIPYQLTLINGDLVCSSMGEHSTPPEAPGSPYSKSANTSSMPIFTSVPSWADTTSNLEGLVPIFRWGSSSSILVYTTCGLNAAIQLNAACSPETVIRINLISAPVLEGSVAWPQRLFLDRFLPDSAPWRIINLATASSSRGENNHDRYDL
ncbi:hypothetical protein Q8A73_006525 [Channa argus]|nr:hypothetical protein Q8A73_006525 [Channa argus]